MTETPPVQSAPGTPPKITAESALAALSKQKRPPSPETFSVRRLRGPIADVVARIQNYAPLTEDDVKAGKKPDANIFGSISEADRAWIIKSVQKSGFAGVVVDVHEHFHEGTTLGHWSVSRLY